MRKSLLVGWLLLPIGAWAYHEGPGQDRLVLDDAERCLRAADAAVAEEHWETAVAKYQEALSLLPAEPRRHVQQVRLELAKARMQASELPVARADLADLVAEMQAQTDADATVLAGARDALANSQYYMTWLMRLEGMPREKWEPEIEAARQTYALLAEQAQARGDDAAAHRHQQDLESSVRLARMELSDLQGLPLPSQ